MISKFHYFYEYLSLAQHEGVINKVECHEKIYSYVSMQTQYSLFTYSHCRSQGSNSGGSGENQVQGPLGYLDTSMKPFLRIICNYNSTIQRDVICQQSEANLFINTNFTKKPSVDTIIYLIYMYKCPSENRVTTDFF